MIDRSRRSGLTLIEVMVSVAIVSGLVLVLLAANVPISRASAEVGVAFDLDRSAAKFLSELRRELRQSGYETTTQLFFVRTTANADVAEATLASASATDGVKLVFRRRTSFGPTVNDTNTSNWSRWITYTHQPSRAGKYFDSASRFVIQRQQDGGVSADVIDNVSDLTLRYYLQPEGTTAMAHVEVVLTLRKENPGWNGEGDGRTITRTYRDDIELLNKRPSDE